MVDIKSRISLKAFNTLSLPSEAEYFSEFSSLSELLDLISVARSSSLKVRVLGGGSNVLCSPVVKGLVIRSAMTRIRLMCARSDRVLVSVDAGVVWHDWVKESRRYGFGLENLALIPGTVGASPVQNIGAYGVEVAEFIESVHGVFLDTGQLAVLDGASCRFGYRDSIFKRELDSNFVITRVVFSLKKQYEPVLGYAPLADFSSRLGRVPISDELIDEVCSIRDQRLPRPELTPNAGSFFKNPIVSNAFVDSLKSEYPAMPVYPFGPGRSKLAAGWLIDQCGWKGRKDGHVSMYERQALVLITDGRADRSDIDRVVGRVVRDVQSQFGVLLEPEPVSFG